MLETMDYDRLYRLVGGGHWPISLPTGVKLTSQGVVCGWNPSDMRHTEQKPANETCAIAVCRPGTSNIHPAAEKKTKKNKTVLYGLLVVFWFPCAETAPKSGRQRTQRLPSFPSIRWLPGCGKDIKSRCDSLLPAQFSSCRGFRIDHRRASESSVCAKLDDDSTFIFFPRFLWLFSLICSKRFIVGSEKKCKMIVRRSTVNLFFVFFNFIGIVQVFFTGISCCCFIAIRLARSSLMRGEI